MSMLTRWDPFNQMWREMSQLQRDVGRLFGEWNTGLRPAPLFAVSYPLVNVWEDGDFLYAEAELPGLRLEDLEIFVTGGDQLTINGRREPAAVDKAVWHRQERGFGKFSRVITLPLPVDADRVQAQLENGVLTIQMAKSEEAKPKKITVKAG